MLLKTNFIPQPFRRSPSGGKEEGGEKGAETSPTPPATAKASHQTPEDF